MDDQLTEDSGDRIRNGSPEPKLEATARMGVESTASSTTILDSPSHWYTVTSEDSRNEPSFPSIPRSNSIDLPGRGRSLGPSSDVAHRGHPTIAAPTASSRSQSNNFHPTPQQHQQLQLHQHQLHLPTSLQSLISLSGLTYAHAEPTTPASEEELPRPHSLDTLISTPNHPTSEHSEDHTSALSQHTVSTAALSSSKATSDTLSPQLPASVGSDGAVLSSSLPPIGDSKSGTTSTYNITTASFGLQYHSTIMASSTAGTTSGVSAPASTSPAAASAALNPAAQPDSTVTASQNGAPATPGQTQQQPQNSPSSQSQPLDLMRRNTRPEPNSMRAQPDRSRSRAKRRFSGSTANSSHSPGSERGTQPREREEGRQSNSGSSRRGPDAISIPAKPAPWGVIGVCALDVKARSKPSRNILNRLINNREFDVVVFGDKVILDEGMSGAARIVW